MSGPIQKQSDLVALSDGVRFRRFALADLGALYEISLLTGDAGGDATALHRDPKLIGEIYSAPYAIFEPSWAFVVEDALGVAGYVVGAPDTRRFERRLESDWWPTLRRRYPHTDGEAATWTADQLRSWLIHHPRPAPDDVVADYPAHLHMNLHPRLQGRGVGGQLLKVWLSAAVGAGVAAVHLGTNPGNARALAFWSCNGFSRLVRPGSKPRSTIWFGRSPDIV